MKIRRLALTLFLGLVLTLATLWALAIPGVLAADIGVTIFTDGGPGSLREAITTANGNGEDDTITLPAGTYTLTIIGTDEDSNATGDLDITSSDALAITGAGAENTTINANGIDRVLHIHAGTVVISGVTIYNGSIISGNNGSIINGNGGGIYNDDAGLTLINTRVYGNSADDGGGVYVGSGSTTMTGTQVLSNSAYVGGGVYVYEGSATMIGTQVLNNSASSEGGGVYVLYGSATLNASGGMINSNSASSEGGGVFVYEGSATLTGTQVLSNSADNGGGVYVHYGSATLNASGGMINSNLASSEGGGVYVYQGSATLTGTQVLSNLASFSGGGVYVHYGSATLNASGGMIDNNSASESGGGVFVYEGSATLAGTQVLNNSASSGGGLYLSSSGAIIAANSCIVQNSDIAVVYGDIATGTLNASDNWWGSANGPGGEGSGDGDTVSTGVSYMPFKTVAPAGCSDRIQPAPEITIMPLSLAFGGQDVDDGPTASQTVTITNDGDADLHVSSISLTGSDLTEFAIESGGIAVTLTANSTHTVQVSFDPTTAGAKSANLSVASDDDDEATVDVALTGTGTEGANVAPVADGGGNQSVTVGEVVTLDGSNSYDPDGDVLLIYSWAQEDGPAVTFTPNLSITTFTAPTSTTVLTFTLTVTDALDLPSTPDMVVITVSDTYYHIYLPVVLRGS
ncbi:MAG: choice-of-anchor D domain-containing protein [Chloroflexi bacterium]|nr:choice-of-anchor D domain-containing protein [Chloroflexota bacterium]